MSAPPPSICNTGEGICPLEKRLDIKDYVELGYDCGEGQGVYTFVGERYLEGSMSGEALRIEGAKFDSFVLV